MIKEFTPAYFERNISLKNAVGLVMKTDLMFKKNQLQTYLLKKPNRRNKNFLL